MLNLILDLFDDFKCLTRRYFLANKSFKRNSNIAINKADKGNNVVILDKSDYVCKAPAFLRDNSTSQKLRCIPNPHGN